MGDEEDEIEKKNPSKASEILQKLRDEALARKQKRISDQYLSTDAGKDDKPSHVSSQVSSQSPKRQQKMKKEKNIIKSTKEDLFDQLVQNDKEKSTESDRECVGMVRSKSVGHKNKRRRRAESVTDSEECIDEVSDAKKPTVCAMDTSSNSTSPSLPKSDKKKKKHRQSVGTVDSSSESTKKEKLVDDSLEDTTDLEKSTDVTDDHEQAVTDSLADLTTEDDNVKEKRDLEQGGTYEVGGFTVLGDYKMKQVEKVYNLCQ